VQLEHAVALERRVEAVAERDDLRSSGLAARLVGGRAAPGLSRTEFRTRKARLVYGSTSLGEHEKERSQVRRRPRLEATELDLELARY
jgi:hypothetical protein